MKVKHTLKIDEYMTCQKHDMIEHIIECVTHASTYATCADEDNFCHVTEEEYET